VVGLPKGTGFRGGLTYVPSELFSESPSKTSWGRGNGPLLTGGERARVGEECLAIGNPENIIPFGSRKGRVQGKNFGKDKQSNKKGNDAVNFSIYLGDGGAAEGKALGRKEKRGRNKGDVR